MVRELNPKINKPFNGFIFIVIFTRKFSVKKNRMVLTHLSQLVETIHLQAHLQLLNTHMHTVIVGLVLPDAPDGLLYKPIWEVVLGKHEESTFKKSEPSTICLSTSHYIGLFCFRGGGWGGSDSTLCTNWSNRISHASDCATST